MADNTIEHPGTSGFNNENGCIESEEDMANIKEQPGTWGSIDENGYNKVRGDIADYNKGPLAPSGLKN